MRLRRKVFPLFAAGVSCLALSLVAPEAAADWAPVVTRAPVIVAPKKKQDPGVQYPKQAIAERFFERVQVTLVLDVSAEGTVTDAVVSTPVGHGFDEAAIVAAKQVLFEPATRDGTPVAAKIKLGYEFVPPSPRLSGIVKKLVNDAPIAHAVVRVTLADGTEQTTSTDDAGAWKLGIAIPGKVHVSVASEGFVTEQTDDVLSPAEETALVMRLAHVSAPPPVAQVGDGGVSGAEAIEEVTVKGERPPREVTKRTIDADEIEHMPGSNGDVLRAILNLPGVARPPPFSGQIIVRGSAPEDTQILANGTNIPIAYHFGGFDSVIPAGLMNKADFYPGNFSTQFGRGMGGVVDLGLRDPKSDKLHAVAQVDLIDARVVAEGPIFNTGWNFLVAARRSWFDLWLGPVLNDLNAGVSVAPRYYDWQAELQRDFNKHSSFRVFFFGSNDAFAILNVSPSQSQPTFAGGLNFAQSFWRVQAQYENRFSTSTQLRVTASMGRDFVNFGLGSNYFDLAQTPISVRAELSQKIAPKLIANFGIDGIETPYNVQVSFPPFPKPGQPSAGPDQPALYTSSNSSFFLPGAYAELEYTPTPTTRIVPGIREDYDTITRAWDTSPRITVRQVVKDSFPRTTLKGGVGVFYQPPQPQETDPVFGMGGLHSNRSIHYDIGYEQEFTRQIELTNDVWYKSFDNLVELSSNPAVPGGNVGSGFAYGTEWLLKYKSDSHFFGWIAYTISRSERRPFPGQPLTLFEYDEPQVFTAVASYLLPRGWRVGARGQVTSGFLYTPTSEGAFDATAGSQAGVSAVPEYGKRLPAFEELDIRIDKSWVYSTWKLTAYLDLWNATNKKNPAGVTYSYNYTQSAFVNGLPILPSLGVRAEF